MMGTSIWPRGSPPPPAAAQQASEHSPHDLAPDLRADRARGALRRRFDRALTPPAAARAARAAEDAAQRIHEAAAGRRRRWNRLPAGRRRRFGRLFGHALRELLVRRFPVLGLVVDARHDRGLHELVALLRRDRADARAG